MTSCADARAALLMLDLGTIEDAPEIGAHFCSCAQCAASLATVRTATAASIEMLAGWRSLAEPMALAERCIGETTSWRARQSRRMRVMLVTAATVMIMLWVLAVSGRTAGLRAALGFPDPPYTTAVLLECATPEAAAEVAFQYLHARGSEAVPGTGGARSVTLRGPRDEVAQAEIAVAKLDGRLGSPTPGSCPR